MIHRAASFDAESTEFSLQHIRFTVYISYITPHIERAISMTWPKPNIYYVLIFSNDLCSGRIHPAQICVQVHANLFPLRRRRFYVPL